MTSRLTIRCPACGQQFLGHKSERTRKNCIDHLIKHLTNVHHTSDAEARRMVDELNLGSEGTPLEQAIRDRAAYEWDEMVAAGIIKEVPRTILQSKRPKFDPEPDDSVPPLSDCEDDQYCASCKHLDEPIEGEPCLSCMDLFPPHLSWEPMREPEDDGVPPLSDPDPVRVNLETIRILSRMQECDGDQCTIGANYHPDFQGKASTTRKEPSFEVTLSATTPDGITYQQETDIEWRPPPNTAVKVAEMKKEARP